MIDGALKAKKRNAAWYERPDRNAESTNYRIAVSDIQETRREGSDFAAPNCSESDGQFLEISRDSASGTGNTAHAQ